MGLFSKKRLTLSDKWEVYFTTMDGYVTSIRVDVGAKADKKFASLVHTYLLRVGYTEMYENGLPLMESLQKLNAVEDWIDQKAAKEPIYLVGAITQNGSRDFIFQSERQLDWNQLVDKILQGGPEIILQRGAVLDDNGVYYNSFLYPSKYDFNWIENAKVCRALAEGGEVFRTPRVIDYFAYFSNEDDAKSYADELGQSQYAFTVKEIKGLDGSYSVAFTNNDVPEQEHITAVTNSLLDLAEQFNGQFDGWGTTIEAE